MIHAFDAISFAIYVGRMGRQITENQMLWAPLQPNNPSLTVPNGISSGTRIPELDGARGLAAFVVVVSHYFGEVEHGLGGLRIGWMGVSLFFVLSGFLIGSIILERRDSPNFFSVFYIRRALRIFPVYFLIVTLTLGFLWVHGTTAWTGQPLPALSYLTFTQNFFMALREADGTLWLLPTWTLAVEEQFYLTIPLIIVLLPTRRIPSAIVLGIAAFFVMRATFFQMGHENAAQVLLVSSGHFLLVGVLAALVHQRYTVSNTVLRFIQLVAIIGMTMTAWQTARQTISLSTFFVLCPFLMSVLFACYMLLFSRSWRGLPFLGSPVWQALGTISYCLYLIHQPVAGIMHGLILGSRPDTATPSQILLTFAALFTSIGLAWISWVLLEQPLLRIGREWKYRSIGHTEIIQFNRSRD